MNLRYGSVTASIDYEHTDIDIYASKSLRNVLGTIFEDWNHGQTATALGYAIQPG
jgi:hypothetical protein